MEEGMNFNNCTCCNPQKRSALVPTKNPVEKTDSKPYEQSSDKPGIEKVISVDSESSTFDRRIRNMISELEHIHFQGASGVSYQKDF